MTRKRNTLLLIIVLITTTVFANEPVFKQGETLKYKIRYGFINAGYANFETKKGEIDSTPVFHSIVTAKTTGFIDQLYKLHDIYESYHDIDSGLPYLSVMNLSEGKYRYYNETRFFQNELYASSNKTDTLINLEKETFDIVSVVYYFRRMNWDNLSPDEVIELPVLYRNTHFPMYVVYKGKEDITINKNTYRCHKFSPIMDTESIFQKKEDMIIWFSDDKNKIPVGIKFNLLVGAYRVELEEYENLLHPFDAKL
ncbi:DUF3108 domain-containing protein [Paludibacter sp. 221]|uniref:DUF3108 domain-containing protein n=1 Tax=Paludibacter sp. 221 TaxID=2302939 RepID=UPI0013D00ECB|nr:DUF3108 domain-containing protein [Paludibacter sp. 221]